MHAADLLAKGSRIVFLGDSITEAGAGPGGYVDLVKKKLEAMPDLGIEVIGAGISGNRVPDLEARLDRDVISKKPTVVVIYIGINDVWHSQNGKGTPKDKFEAGLKSLVERLDKAGAKTVLCTASVIGEKTDGTNSLDKMLDEYCDVSRKVAREKKLPMIDLRKAFLKQLHKSNFANVENNVLTTDGVHLNANGNAFVAEQMLQGLGAGASHKVLRHAVFFKFKKGLAKEKIDEVIAAFQTLPTKIDAISDFEWGTDVSVENLSAGYTHAFFVTFRDAKARDEYLPHPAHKEFVDLVMDRLDSVFVVDYVAER